MSMSYIVNIPGSIDNSHINLVQAAVNALEADPALELIINIDSSGGDPDPARKIYDLLSNYRARCTTVAGAKCMSSAVIIFLAADTRISGSHTDFMLHPTSWTLWGMYSFMRSYQSLNGSDLTLTLSEVYTLQGQLNTAIKRLTEIEDYTDEILKSRTKLTKKQFRDRRLVNADQHYTAEESIELGISTKII